MSQQSEVSTVKSAERTVRILEALAASPSRLTITELQERMGYPRSSLHALVRTLRELKWVESDEAGIRFGVGPHALLSGTAYLDRDPALPFAIETMEDLRSDVGFTVHYARLVDGDVLYLASRESRNTGFIPRVGRRLPAYITALGQVLLAQLTNEEVEPLLPDRLEKYTPQTITHKDLLRRELDHIRSRGWAFENEQGTEGIACIAAAVDYRIPATDAISCSIPTHALSERNPDLMAAIVLSHVERLTNTLRRNGIR